MPLDLSALDAAFAALPDRPEGWDRRVGVFVIDSPDPADDRALGPALADATNAYITTVTGLLPEGATGYVLAKVEDTETTISTFP